MARVEHKRAFGRAGEPESPPSCGSGKKLSAGRHELATCNMIPTPNDLVVGRVEDVVRAMLSSRRRGTMRDARPPGYDVGDEGTYLAASSTSWGTDNFLRSSGELIVWRSIRNPVPMKRAKSSSVRAVLSQECDRSHCFIDELLQLVLGSENTVLLT
jgi:hypothetical protein